jgi:hypothetical protein
MAMMDMTERVSLSARGDVDNGVEERLRRVTLPVVGSLMGMDIRADKTLPRTEIQLARRDGFVVAVLEGLAKPG